MMRHSSTISILELLMVLPCLSVAIAAASSLHLALACLHGRAVEFSSCHFTEQALARCARLAEMTSYTMRGRDLLQQAKVLW